MDSCDLITVCIATEQYPVQVAVPRGMFGYFILANYRAIDWKHTIEANEPSILFALKLWDILSGGKNDKMLFVSLKDMAVCYSDRHGSIEAQTHDIAEFCYIMVDTHANNLRKSLDAPCDPMPAENFKYGDRPYV